MIERATIIFEKYRFVFLILGALIIAGIMTTISLSLYASSGASKLDFSRPGFEKVRNDIVVEDKDEKPFDTTGDLDAAAMRDFQSRFTKQRDEITKLNNFGSDILSDEALGLTQSAPNDPAEPAAN